MLVHHFLQKCAGRAAHAVRGVLPETMTLLMQYRWPGNVRELENAIERAVSLSHGPLLTTDDLPASLRQTEPLSKETAGRSAAMRVLSLEEVEKRHPSARRKQGIKSKPQRFLALMAHAYRMADRFGWNLAMMQTAES
jgi:DNA-binding NtrC family response regulator